MQTLSEELLKILACPACEKRPPVKLDASKQKLVCASCGRKYPIVDGIPVLLVEEAER